MLNFVWLVEKVRLFFLWIHQIVKNPQKVDGTIGLSSLEHLLVAVKLRLHLDARFELAREEYLCANFLALREIHSTKKIKVHDFSDVIGRTTCLVVEHDVSCHQVILRLAISTLFPRNLKIFHIHTIYMEVLVHLGFLIFYDGHFINKLDADILCLINVRN